MTFVKTAEKSRVVTTIEVWAVIMSWREEKAHGGLLGYLQSCLLASVVGAGVFPL